MDKAEHSSTAGVQSISRSEFAGRPGFNRVLIVDDDHAIRLSVSKLLEFNNYYVDTAGSASEAFEKMKSGGYQLVISDIMMPGVDGIELLRMIKEYDRGVQVIMVTAAASVERSISCLKHGASDFIRKPFRNDEILEAVEKAVKTLEEDARLREGRRKLSASDAAVRSLGRVCQDSADVLSEAIESFKAVDTGVSVSGHDMVGVEEFSSLIGGEGVTLFGAYSRIYGGISGAACFLMPLGDCIPLVAVLSDRSVDYSSFPSAEDRQVIMEAGSILSETFVKKFNELFDMGVEVTSPDFLSFPTGNFVSLLEIREGRKKESMFLHRLDFRVGASRMSGYFVLVFDVRNMDVLNGLTSKM